MILWQQQVLQRVDSLELGGAGQFGDHDAAVHDADEGVEDDEEAHHVPEGRGARHHGAAEALVHAAAEHVGHRGAEVEPGDFQRLCGPREQDDEHEGDEEERVGRVVEDALDGTVLGAACTAV